MFAYCENNPVSRADSTGEVFDTVLDVAFIGYDIATLFAGNGYRDWKNWAALGADIAMAAVPFASGAGQIIHASEAAKGFSGLSRVTVVGETMERVKAFAATVGATDNLYGGFKLYKYFSSKGALGKAVAEIGGKASNIAWLYNKLRSGFTVFDIGIDLTRSFRSSSYMVERIVMTVWKTRNIIKGIYHGIVRLKE